jgi:hypothetical protein
VLSATELGNGGQPARLFFSQSNRDSTSTFLWPCQARLACLFSVFSLQCQELSDFCEESPRHRMADSVHKVKRLPPWGNEVARSARTSRPKNKRRWAQWSGTVLCSWYMSDQNGFVVGSRAG